jgi:hypothetical protein
MGPPPGADAEKWLLGIEHGITADTYRPGSRTADYLARRRRFG